jgi:enoyl-CoA hydratase
MSAQHHSHGLQAMSSSKVAVTSKNSTLIVTIDRPAVRNAVDNETAEALADAFKAFDTDPAMKVAIFTGAGSSFCAGADLNEMASGARRKRWRESSDGPMGPTRLSLSKPVIGAIEGYAVAGGFELALWCDLRVAADNAVFGVFNRRWGVPLMDGGTVRLPRLVGVGRALDIAMTGRPVPATEAFQIGLVNELTAPGRALERALEIAETLGAPPQDAMNLDRQSIHRQAGLSLQEAMDAEFTCSLAAQGVESGALRFVRGMGRHGTPVAERANRQG